ncbi:hypothetical protein [Enterococcus mundtii]|uniref:hypothetical protein n=1 Tax=Enterococcus mundtii TaxID=53346 RepID=UPI003B985632
MDKKLYWKRQKKQVKVKQMQHKRQMMPMYRLFNPNSGEHFYTRDTGERDHLRKIGWNYKGVGWKWSAK